MCVTCGCGQGETRIDGVAVAEPGHADPHVHTHADGTVHSHAHEDGHHHEHTIDAAPARRVQIERDILAKNDAIAAANRQLLADRGVFALNLVSSPGSGKTTLLVRTIEQLAGRLPVAVIEGDQQTTFDADRIRATGAPAI